MFTSKSSFEFSYIHSNIKIIFCSVSRYPFLCFHLGHTHQHANIVLFQPPEKCKSIIINLLFLLYTPVQLPPDFSALLYIKTLKNGYQYLFSLLIILHFLLSLCQTVIYPSPIDTAPSLLPPVYNL